jgi:hypothetical protein
MKPHPLLLTGFSCRLIKSGCRKAASLFLATLSVLFVLASPTAEAAIIIDTFTDTSHLSSSAGSSILNISSGELVVTSLEGGQFGGMAIFIWSRDGSRYNGFSLDPSEQQTTFSMTGVYNVTPSDATPAALSAYVYFSGAGEVNYGSYGLGSIVPVGGDWSLNLLETAEGHFSGVIPTDAVWSTEFYIGANGQEGVGYRFNSMAAVPEPGTFTMLLLAGGVGYIGLARSRRSLR